MAEVIKNRDRSKMENWQMFGKPKEVEDKKTSIFKEYIVPLGTMLIAILTLFAQSALPWWGSLAIAVYVGIVAVVLVVPLIARKLKNWRAWLLNSRLEKRYLPEITVALRRFKPMMEANRSDTIWDVWNHASWASDTKKIIRPNRAHFDTLVTWLDHLNKTVDSTKSSNFKLIASETSAWVQQYVSFCRDAYSQFEELLRSNQLDESIVREVKQGWNHARDEHNQAISNWKTLCLEINSSFDQSVCSAYYETLKTLE